MAVFPALAIRVVLDGRPVATNRPAVLVRGRVLVPLVPALTAVVDRVTPVPGGIVLARGSRRVFVALPGIPAVAWDAAYVPAATAFRALGCGVEYRPHLHALEISLPAAVPLVTPTPYDPANPRVPPRPVFTPRPVPTPRPVVTGMPRPRRTPIPAEAPPLRLPPGVLESETCPGRRRNQARNADTARTMVTASHMTPRFSGVKSAAIDGQSCSKKKLQPTVR
jgi:hypothetical protein